MKYLADRRIQLKGDKSELTQDLDLETAESIADSISGHEIDEIEYTL